MKLLIHPLLTIEDINYANNKNILAANSFEPALELLERNKVTELIMYPFFTNGGNWWSTDINHGQRLMYFINSETFRNTKYISYDPDGKGFYNIYAKSKELTNIRIIMDGGHHSEMMETIRYMGQEWEGCYGSLIGDMTVLIDTIHDNVKYWNAPFPKDWDRSILGKGTFDIKLDSEYWQRRVKAIRNRIVIPLDMDINYKLFDCVNYKNKFTSVLTISDNILDYQKIKGTTYTTASKVILSTTTADLNTTTLLNVIRYDVNGGDIQQTIRKGNLTEL